MSKNDNSIPILWDSTKKEIVTPFGPTVELPYDITGPIVVVGLEGVISKDDMSRLGMDVDGDVLFPINQA